MSSFPLSFVKEKKVDAFPHYYLCVSKEYEVGFTKKFQNFSKTIIRPNCAIFDARDVRNELYSSLYLAQMTVTFVLARLAKFRAI